MNIKQTTKKRVLLIVSMVLFAFSSGTASYDKSDSVTIYPIEGKSRAVVFASFIPQGTLELKISDIDGSTLYKEEYNDCDYYRKIYDFSSLKDGKYQLEASLNGETIYKPFLIENNNIKPIIEKKDKLPVYFKQKGTQLNVSALNDRNEKVTFKVFDYDKVIYEHELGAEKFVQQRFDFTSLKNGNYDVMLCIGDDQYSESFHIR